MTDKEMETRFFSKNITRYVYPWSTDK